MITLGVIGVVAALTLPSIVQQKNDKEAIVILKKMYSAIDNAYRIAIVENGSPDTWTSETNTKKIQQDFADVIESYMKVVKREDNYSLSMKAVNNSSYASGVAASVFMLQDGTGIVFPNKLWTSNNCTANGQLRNLNECMWIIADINGVDKKPNRLGEDMFYFILTKNKVQPAGVTGYWGIWRCRPDKAGDDGEGIGCTAYALRHENRDYLKCKTGREAVCGKLKY